MSYFLPTDRSLNPLIHPDILKFYGYEGRPPVKGSGIDKLSDYFARSQARLEPEKLVYLPDIDEAIPTSEYVKMRYPELASGEETGLVEPLIMNPELLYPWGRMVKATQLYTPVALAGLAGLFTKFTDDVAGRAAKSTASGLKNAASRVIGWGSAFNVDRKQLFENPFARRRLYSQIEQYINSLPKRSTARQVVEKYYSKIKDPMDPLYVPYLESAAQAAHAAMRSQFADLVTLAKTEYGPEAPIIVDKVISEVVESYPKKDPSVQSLKHIVNKILTSQEGALKFKPKAKSDLMEVLLEDTHKRGNVRGSRLREPTDPITRGPANKVIVSSPSGQVTTVLRDTKPRTHEYTVGELLTLLNKKHTAEDTKRLMDMLLKRLEEEKALK